ncbi:MAG: hypothetical protein Q8Q01_05480 [archaeon]|nr:hypothetical protein [archaeon]
MLKKKNIKYLKLLTSEDILDITILIETNEIKRFAINYRANIHDGWREIYRVDNYHGYLHEMKFWRNQEQIIIKDKNGWSSKDIFNYYIDEVTENFQRYRIYFDRALRQNRTERKKNDKNETRIREEGTKKKG